MSCVSAGLLLFRRLGRVEVFLVHPGGPYWARKDDGAWSVPKGLLEPGEDELVCAHREFREETGFDPGSTGAEYDLGSFRLSSGKRLHVWALEGNCDPALLRSNHFEMQWPPRSGRVEQFPEVDRGDWFDRTTALRKIASAQRPILEGLYLRLDRPQE